MKSIFIALILTAGILYAVSGTVVESGFLRLAGKSYDLLYSRDVQFSGLQFISEDELGELLPHQGSNIRWRFFPGEIERELRSHPRVEDVQVRHCESSQLTCFEIAVQERVPRFLAHLQSVAWLVDQDGNFLGTKRDDERLYADLIEVHQLGRENVSPDVVRGRMLHVGKVVELIERELPRQIRGVEFLSTGDLSVDFREGDFRATFSSSVAEPQALKREVSRLKQILAQLDQDTSSVSEIDLALKRSAVVKPRERS